MPKATSIVVPEPDNIDREVETAGSIAAQTNSPNSNSQPDTTHDEIALRAYYLWIERGAKDGSPEVDWLRAEEELRAERMPPSEASMAATA